MVTTPPVIGVLLCSIDGMDSLLSPAWLPYVPDVLPPQFFNVKSIITAVGTEDNRLPITIVFISTNTGSKKTTTCASATAISKHGCGRQEPGSKLQDNLTQRCPTSPHNDRSIDQRTGTSHTTRTILVHDTATNHIRTSTPSPSRR